MQHYKQYDDSQWRVQIKLANSVFSEGNLEPSAQHYQSALDIAKQLFTEFKMVEPLPETLTHTLVISYLNLADCWAAQNKKKEQIHCLIEIYDYLKSLLNDISTSQALSNQAYGGASKTYLELCFCFKEIDAYEILFEIEEDFAELSMIYQAQSSIIH
jgi:tetratricopeptide (TPR) repeat protein